jgi:hypothetical protein
VRSTLRLHDRFDAALQRDPGRVLLHLKDGALS